MAPTRRLRTRNTRRSTKHLVRSIHRVEMGVEIKPSPDPPTWVSAPWWPLTVTARAVKATAYSSVAIFALVLKSLSLSDYKNTNKQLVTFRMRYIDVRIWGLAKQAITLNIPRINAIGTRIKQLNDRGSATQYSRLGWRYGMDSELAVDATDNDCVFEVQGDVSTDNSVLIYLRLLVQLTGIPGAATLVKQELSDLPDQLVQEFEMM